ncbi:palmitoyltransferase [Thraustotheca clavata]|uniref:Palmitoyltransferase n=1 Tax=Thraustotheca clavata TaxID=74557 RepID=A0A1V9Z735_9STRA|nr:palmitoyltransferase [Thraustotheca clavata]
MISIVSRWGKSVWGLFFHQRNCIFQLFYVSLLTLSYSVLFYEAWNTMNWFDRLLAIVLASFCTGLFLRVSFVDPGVITRENVNLMKKYPEQEALYPRGRVCRTCKTIKIPRSKHCSVCDHCVARFDHQYVYRHLSFIYHCLVAVNSILYQFFHVYLVWVNTCIAEHNYNAFFFFLVANICGSGHLVYLLCSVFLEKMTHILTNAEDESREMLVQVLTDIISSPENARMAFVASLAIAAWFFVSLLLGCQMGRIVRNCTANEHFKRQHLHKEHANDDIPTTKRPIAMDMAWGGVGLIDADQDRTLSADEIEYNPYNKGLVHNIHDAFDITRKDKTS